MARTLQRQSFMRSTSSGTDFNDDLPLGSVAEDIVNLSTLDPDAVSGTLIEDMNYLRSVERDIKGDGFRWYTPVDPDTTLSGLDERITDLTVTAGVDRQGWIYVTDLGGQSGGIVSDKIYQDTGNTVIQSGTSDTTDITLDVKASYPLIWIASMSGTTEFNVQNATLPRAGDGSHYTGTVNYSLVSDAPYTIKAEVTTPDHNNPDCGIGACDTVEVDFDSPPELLTLFFTGGYPGSQTQLKAGDTYQISGTTDKPANALRLLNTDAGISQTLAFTLGTSFTVTMTIADRGTSTQALPAHAQARNASGGFGSTRTTDELGGAVDGTDLVNLNNLYPSFVDNGTTFPIGQTAFKGVEVGSQSTTVNDADTAAYTSPHGDFTITSPGVLATVKTITCTNPGDYNDSATNFRIVANRAANDADNTFNKQIEVADVAPTLTVTQPQTRLRADSPAVGYVITATANQNIAAAPVIGIPVSGVWTGGGFVGGPKIWTRTINIEDGDATGIAAWTLTGTIVNNAGTTSSSITGNENVGGFVSRQLIVAPWIVRQTEIGHSVVDTTKLLCENLSKGGAGANGGTDFFYLNSLTNTLDSFAITSPSGVLNTTGDLWYNLDLANAVSNTTGTAIIILEETV